jgi:hypothetical protein
MHPEIGRPQAFCGPHRVSVRNLVQDRLIAIGAVIAALPFLICSVPWAHKAIEDVLQLCPMAHLTLEACLNVLWALIALGAFVRWIALRNSGRRSRLSGFISLTFVLALLFPVISANDDLAQFDLINDAKTSQSITVDLKNHIQLSNSPVALRPPVASDAVLTSFSPLHVELIESAHPPGAVILGDSTANHSPPLC